MANESDHINKVFGSYRITAKIASGGFATVDGKEEIYGKRRHTETPSAYSQDR